MPHMTVPSPQLQDDQEEEVSPKHLLSRCPRTLQSQLVLDLEACARMEEDMQQEDESEGPSSPLCSSLRAIRRARAFGGSEAAMLSSAKAKTWLLHVDGKEKHDNSGPAGLSQAALDQLTGAEENDSNDGKEFETDDDDNSEENYLLRQKRHRAFPNLPLTWISKIPSRAEDGGKCSGLSQADLDDNCVHEPVSEASTDCSEFSEVRWEQESALLCIKRLKAFGGVGEAYAMSEQVMDAKVDSGNCRGLSQADLDVLSVQETFDGVTPSAMRCPGEDSRKPGETSPMGPEAMLLRARRMRAFLGSKSATSFAERALAQATDSHPSQSRMAEATDSHPSQSCTAQATDCHPSRSCMVDESAKDSVLSARRGTSQLELNMLCVEEADEREKSIGVRSPASRVASPQRKRSPKKGTGSTQSPERGGA